MDLETVIAMGGLIVATNAPFYYLSLRNYQTMEWIRAHCPDCIVNKTISGD